MVLTTFCHNLIYYYVHTALEDYGLDSVSAMRLASRVSKEFNLNTAISPFMFLQDPSINGVVNVIIKLYNQTSQSTIGMNVEDAPEMYAELHADEIPMILGIGTVVPGMW